MVPNSTTVGAKDSHSCFAPWLKVSGGGGGSVNLSAAVIWVFACRRFLALLPPT
jgi:hypothetical protein